MGGAVRLYRTLLLVALSLLVPHIVHAQCVNSHRDAGDSVAYNNIKLTTVGLPSGLDAAFQNALNAWNNTNCNKDGKAFPKFVTTTTAGAREITVQYQQGTGLNSSSCGNFSGNTITIYSVAYVGAQLVPCTIPAQFQDTLAHEMGHALGLDHVSNSNCPHSIMSGRQITPSGTYVDRQVQPAECEEVDETNVTPAENPNPCQSSVTSATSTVGRIVAAFVNPCDDGGEGNGPGGTEDPTVTNSGSPVLLDLDGGGFRLTDLGSGVRFDLDRDGWPERLSWTEPGGGDAWLVLDRNGNGQVDDGGELFGDYTDQPAGGERHGYRALGVFDDPDHGGDGDGSITAGDAIFAELRLWIDANHDGTSQEGELLALQQHGVVRIHLDVVESRRRDQHGNEFRYKAVVRLWRRITQSYDVFLLVGP